MFFEEHVKLCRNGYESPVLVDVKFGLQFRCVHVQHGCLHGCVFTLVYLIIGSAPASTWTAGVVSHVGNDSSMSIVCSLVS